MKILCKTCNVIRSVHKLQSWKDIKVVLLQKKNPKIPKQQWKDVNN